MAGSKTRKLTPLPCLPLTGALSSSQRDEVRRYARALLHWQRTLRRWPSLASAPDATPFVSIYANGVLRGCFGSHEGSPPERLSRAFLRAIEDSRFGLVQTAERGRLTAVVSYVRSMRLIDPARIDGELEPGIDGLGVVKAGRPSVIILPQVALDTGADARALLQGLAKKAGLKDWSGCTLFALRTDDVVVRSSEQRAHGTEQTATARAASWLAQLVGSDGAVTFAVDARRRQRLATGPMHHGMAAVLVRALDEQGDHPSATSRARKWLRGEIAKALGGQAVDGWPAEPAAVAGTLALAQMAGIDVRHELEAASRPTELRASRGTVPKSWRLWVARHQNPFGAHASTTSLSVLGHLGRSSLRVLVARMRLPIELLEPCATRYVRGRRTRAVARSREFPRRRLQPSSSRP